MSHLRSEEIEQAAAGRASSPHLAGCARCAEAVAQARVRREMLRALPQGELDEAAFRRVERQLFEEGRLPARSPWRFFLPAASFAVAAAAAVLLFWPAPGPQGPLLAPAPARPPLAFAPAGEPTLIQGGAEMRLEEDGAWQPLALSAAIGEGTAIRTGAGRAAVALAGDTGFALDPATSLTVGSLRDGLTELSLTQGRVTCAVHPLAAGARFAVLAGARRVEVVGTAFAVARDGDAVTVAVEHGVVRVANPLDPGDAVLLRAGETVLVRDGERLSGLSPERLGPDAAAALVGAARRATPPPPERVRLDVGDLPDGSLLEIDDLGAGPVPLSAWLAPGRHHLLALVPGEPSRELWVALAAGDAAQRVAMPVPVVPKSIQPRHEVDPALAAEFSAAVQGHLRELRACYDAWLKRNMGAEGRVVLVLEISADGKVERARSKGAKLPEETSACFTRTVAEWSLPAQGAPLQIEIPLRLQAK